MKLKDFNAIVETIKNNQEGIFAIRRKLQMQGSIEIEESQQKRKLENENTALFNQLKPLMVNVSFCIGFRSYYEAVYKIGKQYFTQSFMKLKKSNYVEEIPTITDKMKNEMISDSYYY